MGPGSVIYSDYKFVFRDQGITRLYLDFERNKNDQNGIRLTFFQFENWFVFSNHPFVKDLKNELKFLL